MRAIRIDNPVLNSYITDLAVDYSSGTTPTVRNNNSFAANDLAVFGNPGEELTEQKKISSLSGVTGFNLASALNFQHNKGTPVYKSLWDFVSIEANYGSGFSVISTSPIQWDSRSNQTIYFDSNGSDSTSYRFRFYNSITGLYSEYSPTLTGAGFTKYQMGYIIRDAREAAGDPEGNILSTDALLRRLTRAKNIIRAHSPRYWFWKVDGYNSSKSIAATAGNNVYSLSSITDLGTVDGIDYQYNNGATNRKYALTRKADAEFKALTRDLNRPSDDYPYAYRLLPADSNSAKGYIEIDKKIQNSGVGTFYIDYYKEESDYNSVDDATAIIMPEILTDFLIAEIATAKGNEALAKTHYDLFRGPEGREKTLPLEKLSGIALLDELDRQYKRSQGQPRQLWRYRGQKAIPRLYGSRATRNTDQMREDYFDGRED